jgi:hypothetical protein
MGSEDLRDELEAIEAIYPECVIRFNNALIDLKIPNHEGFKLRVSFPSNYPEEDLPHILQVKSSSHDDQYLEMLFNEVLQSVYKPGYVCIFDFLTEMDGVLYVEEPVNVSVSEPEPVTVDALNGWTMSEPITDRGSTFVAFAREVHSEQEVFELLGKLKSDRKVARATHNMVSYRIQNTDGTRISDCDDDGETAAGGRILHLLTIMDVWNVIVVVSRWFGGIHIGPDRFKHINSTAREAVINAGFKEDNKKSKKKK